MSPSSEFLFLAATLLDDLPPSLPIKDSLLLQLHLVFGPMLVSALQLVDKREVVRVRLPSDRHVYQVSSSTGKNYTIHLNPPDPMPLPPDGLPDVITGDAEPQRPSDHSSTLSPSSPAASPIRRKQDVDTRMKLDGGIDQGTSKESISPFHTPSPPSPMIGSARAPEPHSEIHLSSKKRKRKTPSDLAREKAELERRDRVSILARGLARMYCPCAGWAYGCLAGEKTVLCKHLLAVIIAHKTGKEVAAEVGLPGVVSLLGLSA